MPKILICDSLYPAFIRSLPFDASSAYDAELRKVLDRSFGTADFYSRTLQALGWDAVDVIYNHSDLQAIWAREHDHSPTNNEWGVLQAQIQYHEPDVVFLQDLSIDVVTDALIAAQCSCAFHPDTVKKCDVIFTSLPTHVPRIEALGVRAVYNPLAFEPSVFERVADKWCREDRRFVPDDIDLIDVSPGVARVRPRIHDVVFIGGVGNPSHWKYGMEVLETVAREIPTFKWWGYGLETLPADSALRRCYMGEAWGLQMYEILLQSKICLNRHGEVAEGCANNMRMTEATGCGAMLLTEDAPNLHQFFRIGEAARYLSPADAVEKIRHYLEYDAERAAIAHAGQNKTLLDHTYAERMKTVSETLLSMLCPA